MPPDQKRSEPQAQTVIAGRYRLEEHRAQGGMAEVWRAVDLQLSRTVAVKLLKSQLATDSTLAERFRREAVAAANLNHFNIVTAYDAIEYDEGRQALIMEYIEGKSLRELLDTKTQLESNLVQHIGVSVCAALEAAHERDIIHRDIKPGNILLTKEGRVMITDFGIAKVLGEGDDLTSENIMMGTAKYLAPEQVKGDPLDERADLYSLGIVLYECLVGKVPFYGKNDTETALARLQREPRNITTLRPNVNPQLAAVVHKLLAREPRNRFRSAADVRLALSNVNSPVSREPEVVARPTPDRTPAAGKVIRPKGYTPNGTPAPSIKEPTDRETRPRGREVREPSNRASSVSAIFDRYRPSTLILGIVGVAIVVVAILVTQSLRSEDSAPTVAPETVAGVTTPVYTGPVEITGVRSFDPEGDDQAENEETVLNVTDGDPETIWTTSCYRSSTFGSKSGLGLVVQLNAVALARMEVDIPAQNWKALVYTATESATTTSQWGRPIWEGSSESGSTIATTFTSPAQYALIYFTEVGRSGMCSSKNPYRGSISEVRVSPAP
ncbi:MAG: serine/threonine-protein kinase [Actinomycetota bacterium]